MKHNGIIKRANLLLAMFLFVANACSSSGNNDNPGNEHENDNGPAVNTVVELEPETQKLLRNPLMGWAIYADAYHPDMNFWDNFDNIKVPNSTTVYKASDYATHLYIRWPWSAFEKQEGEYAWDHDEFLKLLVNGAKERGLKVAFRVYVDSRDYPDSSTPDYVREAGAAGFETASGSHKVWTPYADDAVFQQKFETFIAAFAKQYNDETTVEYVDGFGLGLWGEAHSMVYKNDANSEAVFKWIVDLYAKKFTAVPLVINYHRMLGATKDWGATADSQSEALLGYAVGKGYALRHDAFGMSEYYSDYEKRIAKKYFPERPIIAENGWWGSGSTAWQGDPNHYKSWADVWKQSLADALEAHANIFDLRNAGETKSWFETSFDLIQEFVAIGGYRLYPDQLSLPQQVSNNSTIEISHRWNNLGVGVCPNNISPWNNRYKVAFALLDRSSKKARYILVDDAANPAEWLKDAPKSYTFKPEIKGVNKGQYTWGVAIVDTSKDNARGILLSTKKAPTSEGWTPLLDVEVK